MASTACAASVGRLPDLSSPGDSSGWRASAQVGWTIDGLQEVRLAKTAASETNRKAATRTGWSTGHLLREPASLAAPVRAAKTRRGRQSRRPTAETLRLSS